MTNYKTVTVGIERMGQAGDGVGHLPDGRLIFIPGALPGEVVDARVTELRRNFARGQLRALEGPASPARQVPRCPIFLQCGGCNFQHWDYAEESRYKEDRVKEALKRIAGRDTRVVEPIRPSPNPYEYRNKGQFPFGGEPGRVRLGLYRRGTHEVIAARHCDIQDPSVNEVLAVAEDLCNEAGIPPYREETGEGVLRHLLIRSSQREGHALVLLVVKERHPALKTLALALRRKVPSISGVGLNINVHRTNRVLGEHTEVLAGQRTIEDVILGMRFRLSFTSFFQVNPHQVEVLYGAALGFLPDDVDTVWDLYSGVGTLATLASRKAKHVRALEINPDAAKDAEENFQLNQRHNITIDVGRVEALLDAWIGEARVAPEAVIVDPPRAGLDVAVIDRLRVLRPKRIIYVSCNPDTWARDVFRLSPSFELLKAIPVDMFPRTDHVEVASCLTRLGEAMADKKPDNKGPENASKSH